MMIKADQISSRYDWAFNVNHLKQPKHKFSCYLTQYWETRSKNMDFVDDLIKNSSLDFLIKYDKKFNNKRKVEFESSLASVIRTHPRMLQIQVVKVSSAITKHFMYSFSKAVACQEECHWIHQHFCKFFLDNADIMAEYTGVYGINIPFTLKNKKDFMLWIYNKLNSLKPNDFHCQLLLIREYGNFFLRAHEHLPKFVEQNRETLLEELDIGETSDKIQMKVLWEKAKKNVIENSPPYTSRIPINSKELTDECGIFDSISKYNNLYVEKYCKPIHMHLPGKNVWFVNSTSEFNRRVRFHLDMPLIASQGGSIALLLIPAIISNSLNNEELRLFNLCAISYMVSNGHHSLHEFKSVWNALDVPYIDGSYKSLFPCGGIVESHQELSELKGDFIDLMQSDSG